MNHAEAVSNWAITFITDLLQLPPDSTWISFGYKSEWATLFQPNCVLVSDQQWKTRCDKTQVFYTYHQMGLGDLNQLAYLGKFNHKSSI